MIDKVVNKKMIDALGIIDDKLPGSPRNFRRRNLPPLNTQRSSPVPFATERPGFEEPFGKDEKINAVVEATNTHLLIKFVSKAASSGEKEGI